MRTTLVGLFLGVWLASGLANASPLWQVKGGQTSLALGDALVTALTDCEVSLIKQGAYKPDDAEVRFRVVGGALDADDLAGEVFHSGGIAVSCATMGELPSLALQSFIIDLDAEPAMISGLVTVSDGNEPEIRGRLPLFTLGFDELQEQVGGNGQWLRLSNIDLTPTPQLDLVLAELGLVLEAEGAVARAWSRVQLRRPDSAKGNGNGQDKNKKDDDEDED